MLNYTAQNKEYAMSNIICPHCTVENPPESQFCQSCGKAIATGAPVTPQIVDKQDWATTETGKTLQSEELRRISRKAVTALFAVSILQFLGGILIYFLFKGNRPYDMTQEEYERTLNLTLVVVLGLGVIFALLGFWARKAPLPSAIVGLVLFVSVHLLDALVDPTALVRGWLVKIIVIVVLIKAIQAGLKHRQIQDSMTSS
jgi:membrane-associated HD superfamily phosphohydrolase